MLPTEWPGGIPKNSRRSDSAVNAVRCSLGARSALLRRRPPQALDRDQCDRGQCCRRSTPTASQVEPYSPVFPLEDHLRGTAAVRSSTLPSFAQRR